jgi:sugar phosphate isomerase/epimerase
MIPSRRQFIQHTALGCGALALGPAALLAAEKQSPANKAAAKKAGQSFVRGKSQMKLGMVTFNLGKSWDIPTIIKNCSETGFEGVELRATHAHGVEVTLNKAERAEVRKQFADSPVALASMGSAFDYHTPDQAKLKRDIEATKEYIVLAQDVGATGVKVRPNALPPEVPEQKTLEQIGRSLREVGEFARNHGQQIRLEVHGQGTSLLPNIRKIMDVANHPAVGVCWNCNQADLAGAGFDANFDLVKHKMFTVHLRDLFVEEYPFRRLFARLKEIGFKGFTFAEIPETPDGPRVMRYFRSQWLSFQELL